VVLQDSTPVSLDAVVVGLPLWCGRKAVRAVVGAANPKKDVLDKTGAQVCLDSMSQGFLRNKPNSPAGQAAKAT
jgi:hypothetical protein